MSNYPCLICGSIDTRGRSKDQDNCSIIDQQLNVIFTLKHLLQLPSTKLENFLVICGNPDGWISLCDNCTQLTSEARSLHLQILKLTLKLKGIQNEVVESTKSSVNLIAASLSETDPKITVWKETRGFVQNHNYNDQTNTGSGGAPKILKQEEECQWGNLPQNDDHDTNFVQVEPAIMITKQEPLEIYPDEESAYLGEPLDIQMDAILPNVIEDTPRGSGRFSCNSCEASFLKKSNLTRHVQSVHLKNRKMVTCHLCGVAFKKDYLKKHMLFKHPDRDGGKGGGGGGGGGAFRCKVVGCKLPFVTKEGLDKHIMSMHVGGGGGRRFSCGYCEKSFCLKYKLRLHEEGHRNQELGIKPFKCDICGEAYGTRKSVIDHKRRKHKLAVVEAKKKKMLIKEENQAE